jgi:3-oxoadipate enol-lactonase
MTGQGATTESIEVLGGRLEFHRRGPLTAGPAGPVVLLHPWFGCWQFWNQTVDAPPGFDTFNVDLYSLGARADWQEFASPDGLARAVGMLLDALRIDRCSVIGNSMGGIAAQVLAAATADRIEKLVLVGTGARTVGVKPDWRQAMDEWIAGPADREFAARMVGALLARRPDDPREFEVFVDMVMNANKAFIGTVLTNAFKLDLRSRLPGITASTLVIRGELDASRTRTHVEELLAGISNSRAVEIPGPGIRFRSTAHKLSLRLSAAFFLLERLPGSTHVARNAGRSAPRAAPNRLLRPLLGAQVYGNVALFLTLGNHVGLRGLPGGGHSPAEPVSAMISPV